ncbi:rac GTPase-activating protein 1-like [Euwallacea similis]|uniref:rac GTPase-activating protein 1-like n=1 Tax=Euwallacea similis TaxID=1736056 RepID=UPI00344D0539
MKMSDTPFKIPLSHCLKRSNDGSEKSDSEGSTTSEGLYSSGSCNDLTIVAMYDDLLRLMASRRDTRIEVMLEQFAKEYKQLFAKYSEVLNECQRLQTLVDLKVQECSEAERRMNTARHILDEEKKKCLKVTKENEELHDQLSQVRELLFRDNRVKIGDDAKEKLSFLNRNHVYDNNVYNVKNLSCIHEAVNSTGSMLSDFSVSRSEDDLDISRHGKRDWKKHRPSVEGEVDPPQKKMRSTNKVIEIGAVDTVRTTTTLTIHKKGPITASSVIESVPNDHNGNGVQSDMGPSSDDGIGSTAPSVPPHSHLIFESWAKNGSPLKSQRVSNLRPDLRQHSLQQKTIVMPDSCICCEKRLRFGKSAMKCKECRSVCHFECKDQLALPCVPVVNTPTNKYAMGLISDYTPTLSPMVPALVIHCTNEIELRGLNELGLYRISASEKEVKLLKERFLRGRGSPSLTQIDIHVICGCVKEFLRSLNEPLVTNALWADFTSAVEAKDPQDIAPALYQCISELPQPNRDTLAYMTLHLQKVAESPECKMPIENLAKVFGPTLVGYSSDNPKPDNLLNETRKLIAVAEQLMRLPSDYWASFVNISSQNCTGRLQNVSSTGSLLKPNGRFLTPRSARSNKKRKIFDTPPSIKRY